MAIVDGIITLDDARKSLGWATSDTANNADLESYISAVTPLVENVVGPVVVRSKSYTLDGGNDVVMLPDPITSLTSVLVGGVPLTGCVADVAAGLVYAPSGLAFEDGRLNVVVTAQVGMNPVPPNIVLAAREIVRHLWQVGRQGTRPTWGTAQADSEPMVPSYFALPKRAIELLAPHARPGGFA